MRKVLFIGISNKLWAGDVNLKNISLIIVTKIWNLPTILSNFEEIFLSLRRNISTNSFRSFCIKLFIVFPIFIQRLKSCLCSTIYGRLTIWQIPLLVDNSGFGWSLLEVWNINNNLLIVVSHIHLLTSGTFLIFCIRIQECKAQSNIWLIVWKWNSPGISLELDGNSTINPLDFFWIVSSEKLIRHFSSIISFFVWCPIFFVCSSCTLNIKGLPFGAGRNSSNQSKNNRQVGHHFFYLKK